MYHANATSWCSCSGTTIALEADIGLGDPTQECRDEFIYALAGLAGEIRQPLFQRRIHGDSGFGHVVVLP